MYYKIFLQASQRYQKIDRQYPHFMIMLADIGGFIEIFYVLVGLLNKVTNRFQLRYFQMQKVFGKRILTDKKIGSEAKMACYHFCGPTLRLFKRRKAREEFDEVAQNEKIFDEILAESLDAVAVVRSL